MDLATTIDVSLVQNQDKENMSLTDSSPLLTSKEHSVQHSGYYEKTGKGSTWIATVILLVNTCIGAGMLNMASAFSKSGGVTVGIPAQFILSFIMGSSMVILCYCSDIYQDNTLQDVVHSLCGRKAMIAASIALVLYSFGLVVSFMIVIGDQLVIFLTFTYGPKFIDHWYLSRSFMMFTTICIFVLPLCYPARIDFLKYASFIGFIAAIYMVLFMIARYCTTDYSFQGDIHLGTSSYSNMFGIVPTTLLAYQCHMSIVPIYSCLENRNMKELMKLMAVAMPIIIFVFTSSGAVGYLTFGADTNEDVLLSYRPVTTDLLIATILIASKMYTDAPILTFVGRTAIDSIYCNLIKVPENEIVKYEKRRRIIVASIWFAAALSISIALPHIGAVIALMGGIAALFSIIIPGACLLQALLQGHIKLTYPQKWTLFLAISTFYIIFGVFIMTTVLTEAVMEDILGQT